MDNSGYQQQPALAVPVRPVEVPSDKNKKDLIKNIVIAVLAILVLACGTVAALKIVDYNKLSNNFDSKLESSLTEKIDDELTKLEREYTTKYNQPNNKFVGPEDYGRVEFEYPRTWNVYVATDNSSNGGNYASYFNPDVVPPVGKNTAYAMSFEIVSDSFETVTKKYNDTKKAHPTKPDAPLKMRFVGLSYQGCRIL